MKNDGTTATSAVRIMFDPLQELHKSCEGRVNDAVKRIVDRTMKRYCGVCFFGNHIGTIFGIPVCKECAVELFGDGFRRMNFADATPEQISMFQKFAMRARDAHESLYMKLVEEIEKLGVEGKNKV